MQIYGLYAHIRKICDYTDFYYYSVYSDYSDYIYRFKLKWAFQIQNGMCCKRTSQTQFIMLETSSDLLFELHDTGKSRNWIQQISQGLPLQYLTTVWWLSTRTKPFLRIKYLLRNIPVPNKNSFAGLNPCTPNWLSSVWTCHRESHSKMFPRNKTPRSNSNRLAFCKLAILFWIWQE